MMNKRLFENEICAGLKVWPAPSIEGKAELACAMGVSNLLDFLVLLRQGKSTMKNSENIFCNYDIGDYEKEITAAGSRHLHYISGGAVLATIFHCENF